MGNYLGLAEDYVAMQSMYDFQRGAQRRGAATEPFSALVVDNFQNVTGVPRAAERLGQKDVAFYVACKRVDDMAKAATTRPRRGATERGESYTDKVLREYFRLHGRRS